MTPSPEPGNNFTDKISIGIPTYNRPATLKRTLDTLLKQSYTNLEIIVSDNASTDPGVKRLLIAYSANDPRIVTYFQPHNIGMIKNFDFVREKATGGFFLWKSDDDIIEDPDFLLKLYTELKNGDHDFVFAEGFYLKDDGSRLPILSTFYAQCRTKRDYLMAITSSFSCLEFYGMYKMANFDKSKEFYINENSSCPDVQYLPYLFLKHKVAFVPSTYYLFAHVPSPDGFRMNLNLFRDRQIVMRDLISVFAATELLAPAERAEIVANILTYYESIIHEDYSVSKFTRFKTRVKNQLKALFRIGKS